MSQRGRRALAASPAALDVGGDFTTGNDEVHQGYAGFAFTPIAFTAGTLSVVQGGSATVGSSMPKPPVALPARPPTNATPSSARRATARSSWAVPRLAWGASSPSRRGTMGMSTTSTTAAPARAIASVSKPMMGWAAATGRSVLR
ncbi:MAG: hypothetical protein KatS3mg061_1239 [Dehalococcoidia bacterium]|nr:MAG: hypothetical protein KatS3mg061_1239 [Dehalococcoidia bacterium]